MITFTVQDKMMSHYTATAVDELTAKRMADDFITMRHSGLLEQDLTPDGEEHRGHMMIKLLLDAQRYLGSIKIAGALARYRGGNEIDSIVLVAREGDRERIFDWRLVRDKISERSIFEQSKLPLVSKSLVALIEAKF